jgi:hypothetical protein
VVTTFYAECDDCDFDVGSAPTGYVTDGAAMLEAMARHHRETGHQGYGILIRKETLPPRSSKVYDGQAL